MKPEDIAFIRKHFASQRLSVQEYRKLMCDSTLFGSRVFGGAEEESDYDFIVDESRSGLTFEKLCLGFGACYLPNDYHEEEFKSVYLVDPDGNIMNFLCFPEPEVADVWKKASRIMCNLIEREVFIKRKTKVKKNRVALFEFLKWMVKSGEGISDFVFPKSVSK